MTIQTKQISFTEHPASVGESYLQHMGTSFGFGARLVIAGMGCLVHGILPFLCVTTGSRTIDKLHSNMVTHRDKRIDYKTEDHCLAQNLH